ncbi:hypothetical protein ACTHAM_002360 [Cellulomonas soli]|uniref:hypothetical protein n=1 Tax=Cellulomonas soli TaxID=931535 RepID=UPI003F826CA5
MTMSTKDKDTAAPAPTTTVDVVALPSLRADGTPDQTPGFVQLVPDSEDPRTPSAE